MILERLTAGSLNVSTVRLLAPHLTSDKHEELLTAARHRSKREVEELVAHRFPRPDTPSSVRKVPERRPTPASASAAAPIFAAPAQHSLDAVSPPMVTPLPVKRALVSPLTALLDLLARQKLAVVRRPQRKARPAAPGSRHAPSKVKRAVWMRDGGRCAFVGAGGHRCSERAFLEYHHVTPYGVGGEATVANIQLRCRAHNGYESDLFYGSNRSRDGAGVVRESHPNHAVSWGFELVPGRVGSCP